MHRHCPFWAQPDRCGEEKRQRFFEIKITSFIWKWCGSAVQHTLTHIICMIICLSLLFLYIYIRIYGNFKMNENVEINNISSCCPEIDCCFELWIGYWINYTICLSQNHKNYHHLNLNDGNFSNVEYIGLVAKAIHF